MLDDLKMIHQRDAQDALGHAAKQSDRLAITLGLSPFLKANHIHNVVVAAVGDASLAADMMHGYVSLGKPYQVMIQHDLPAYVDTGTVFIATSLSLDDPEALALLARAEAKRAQVVVISVAGALARAAMDAGHPLVLLPEESRRFPLWSVVKALLLIFDKLGLLPTDSRVETSEMKKLEEQQRWLAGQCSLWGPESPTKTNVAKQIALELMGKSVAIYAGPTMSPAANYWKARVNLRARQLAWCDQYVDDNVHAEACGWLKQPVSKPYAIVDLRSSFEHRRIQQIQLANTRLLSGLRPSPVIIEFASQTFVQHLLFATVLADFVSIYLALLGGLNPSIIDLSEKFNKELL